MSQIGILEQGVWGELITSSDIDPERDELGQQLSRTDIIGAACTCKHTTPLRTHCAVSLLSFFRKEIRHALEKTQ